MKLYIPSRFIDSSKQHFSDMLNIPGFGTTVTINPNLSDSPTQAKVQLSNPNFKTNYQNITDNAKILRFNLEDNIKKGDYLTENSSGITYLVTWQPFKDINSYKSQCQICNASLVFETWKDAVLDDNTGEVVSEAGYSPVASNIKCFTSRSGMGIFSSGVGEVGILPLGRMVVGVQFNDKTAKVKIGHEFNFHNSQYKIIDIDFGQLDDSENLGCLVFHTEKLEGGRKTEVVI